jgi:hypothetical protein
MEPLLSVLGGGLAAAVVTIGFNVLWDKKKQKASEDWEFRRYHANQVHFATAGLMEVFFAAKIELYFLTATLETLLAGSESGNHTSGRDCPAARRPSNSSP